MAILLLEDGTKINAESFASVGETFGEIIFNTSTAGYQEIITDPAYAQKIIVMTYPEIGNYGINDDDFESLNPALNALIVKEYSKNYSHYKSKKSLGDFLIERNIIGLKGVDTRFLTHKIRDLGTMKCYISTKDLKEGEIEEKLKQLKIYTPNHDIVSLVTTKENYIKGKGNLIKLACIDLGAKYGIIKTLSEKDCEVSVFSSKVDEKTILNGNFDALFLTNGAGEAKNLKNTIQIVENLKGKLPIFAIGLGCEVLALCLGAKVNKLKYGHHSTNHPVINTKNQKVLITSQNHNFEIDETTLCDEAKITYKNLNDETIEGFEIENLKIHAIEFTPDCGDSSAILDSWVELMKKYKEAKV